MNREMLHKKVQEGYVEAGTTDITRRVIAKCFWYFYSPFANFKQLAERYGTDNGPHIILSRG